MATAPRSTRIEAPARLHLGFLDPSASRGRRFGSIGLALDNIATVVSAAPYAEFVMAGVGSERAREHAANVISHYGLNDGLRVKIEQSIPAHAGLGSGTQLALAVGTALLEANACRNIQEFNKRVQQHADGEGAALQRPRNPEVAFEDRTYSGGVLPYIVVVIDEMADLMMTVQGEVETPIAMLAQKARAIGIHLILATQRPSVNVITGLIKANFPCRIAFRVASQIDSRTIIDGAGAEALLGNGDMLFIPPGKSEPSRLQGAFLSSEDTEHLLGWYANAAARRLAEQAGGDLPAAEPDILETIRAIEAKASGGDDDDAEPGGGDRDKLFRDAAEVVIQHRQGSTSLLQRRLKIGYGRAARIIDQLEEAGVLSPSEGGARPRDVLVGIQDLDRICGTD